jgi:Ca2+-binding RTX toxin-like protein
VSLSTPSAALAALPEAAARSLTIGPGAGAIALDNVPPLAQADYGRVGHDLTASWPDGTTLVVREYFAGGQPAALATAAGERLEGDLVARLAGPLAPGQVAQLESGAGVAIGQVGIVDGEATATRVDGTTVVLQAGSPIFQGDVLATGARGALAITFADGTSFSLGAGARMVVDEFVYNPGEGVDQAAFDVLQGVFTFVSGEVAHETQDGMTLTTPVATIGIRGTALGLRILAVGLESLIALLRDPDGDLGSVTVASGGTTIVLDDENEGTIVTSLGTPPGNPFVLTPGQLTSLFGALLAQLGLDPSITDDDAEDGGEDGEVVGEGDADDDGATDSGGLDSVAIQVTLATGEIATFEVATEPVNVLAEQLTSLSVIGLATLDTGETVLAIGGFGDDDEVVFVVVEADNVIQGSAGADVLNGSDATDAIFGLDGNDSLFGLGGNDTISGDAGDDVLDGGADDDLLTGDGLGGVPGNDIIHGGDGNDVVLGDAQLALGGVGGDDQLFGDAGDDVIQPGPGVDSYDGGPGRDLLTLLDGSNGANIDLDLGHAFDDGFGNFETFTGIEDVVGTANADTIAGSGGSNALSGFEGNDVLTGAGGDDNLLGGDGNDLLIGGPGIDVLSGDDLDAGADIFKFFSVADIGAVPINIVRGPVQGDILVDFTPGQDTIQIVRGGFDADMSTGPLTLGTDFSVINFLYDGTDAGDNANFGESGSTFVFSTADNTLYFDSNQSGDGYFVVATFANGVTPNASDIEIVNA